MATASLQLLQLDDPANHAPVFWLMTIVGLAIGGIVTALLRFPHLRRPHFQSGQAWSWPMAVLGGLALATPIGGCAYARHWARFFALELRPDVLVLHYHSPKRECELRRADLREIVTQLTGDKGRRAWATVLVGADGSRFASTPLTATGVDTLARTVRAWRDQGPR
ncbi:MAG: hypothetical protein R3F56_01605 [Planctomycetota bacterium]